MVLTKLDGSAKGGIVFAVQTDLGIPVKLVGLGEAIGDLVPFDPDEFVDALFEESSHPARRRLRSPLAGLVASSGRSAVTADARTGTRPESARRRGGRARRSASSAHGPVALLDPVAQDVDRRVLAGAEATS